MNRLGGARVYRNKYYIEMKITMRLSSPFSMKEIQMLENARVQYNNYYVNATRRQTENRKHISKIVTKEDIIGFYLETEFTIANTQRIGNALRMYAIVAATNGFDEYVSNQRLMRAT